MNSGDRDLVVDPVGIVTEMETTFLSSGHKIFLDNSLGISNLSSLFDNSVWFYIIIAFMSVLLISMLISYVQTIIYPSHHFRTNSSSLSWHYLRTILKQCKLFSI
jgi:hypothetical protein